MTEPQDTLRHSQIKTIDNPFWNKDLDPIALEGRTWSTYNFIALWISMVIAPGTFMLGSGLIASGMNWWQAGITMFVGSMIVVVPIILTGCIGTKYGISFPIVLRVCFGMHGAKLIALVRGAVACCWFGISSWIGSGAVFAFLRLFFPSIQNFVVESLELNYIQFACFIAFICLEIFIICKGMHGIKFITSYSTPILIIFSVILFVWAWVKAGSFSAVLSASCSLQHGNEINFGYIFLPSLTAIVGVWCALSLSIPDFTRYAKSQKSQIVGQSLSLPFAMTLYSFLGVFVAGTSILIYGTAIWNPDALIEKFDNPIASGIATLVLIVSVLTTNLAANIVSPANDISNLFPRLISFRTGGVVACILGIFIFPWKILADPYSYIFVWLTSYPPVMGAIAGIIISDYYLVRKRKIVLSETFNRSGIYSYTNGWNITAFITVILAVIPIIPGFISKFYPKCGNVFPNWIIHISDYGWWISSLIAITLYYGLMTLNKKTGISGSTTKSY